MVLTNAASLATQTDAGLPLDLDINNMALIDFESGEFETEFDAHYGLLAPEQTVLVRPYSDDTDDRMLAEMQPKFIVMFEPNMEFIRRIEVGRDVLPSPLSLTIFAQVYRSSNPGLGVRVYHMVYGNSCEEYKYLAGIRREKESFERLIKERGVRRVFLLPFGGL